MIDFEDIIREMEGEDDYMVFCQNNFGFVF